MTNTRTDESNASVNNEQPREACQSEDAPRDVIVTNTDAVNADFLPVEDNASLTKDEDSLDPSLQPRETESKAIATPPTATDSLQPSQMKETSKPDLSVIRLIEKADHSAGKLVNLLAKHFPSFRDETRFEGRKVRFLKRAQIFVADLWAAFNGTSYGAFDDIEHLTMFAGMLFLCDIISVADLILKRN